MKQKEWALLAQNKTEMKKAADELHQLPETNTESSAPRIKGKKTTLAKSNEETIRLRMNHSNFQTQTHTGWLYTPITPNQD
ncbi:hypothetical protein EVAR_33562_1 [Eumeta japonica]|uniref:Uncharacterized protein n=1 Tax=Eumeta variegata TaxID=151549 RepID=A0A4C1VJV8_EUMVA|nr:hypothetical protein EVAR_33562_1 [Eumeta japonica]